MYLGCGKDKQNVRGRLLKSFEQGVERLCCEHMDLVDNIYPVFAASRLELYLLDDIADIVDFAV